ncbi:hypothetical protein Tco_0018933, partial [Tanacetum coccineum]
QDGDCSFINASEDGHHMITLSNISNIQQLHGSVFVPTHRINSSQPDIVSHNDHSMYMLRTCANIGKQRTMHKSQHDATGTNVSRMSNEQPNSQPNPGKRANEISQTEPVVIAVSSTWVTKKYEATTHYLNPNIPEVHRILDMKLKSSNGIKKNNLKLELWSLSLLTYSANP